MKKQEINIKHELSVEETVDLFNEISKSISEGTISIEYGEKQISLKPGCRFDVEIEATRKKGKQKLNIELSWKEEDPTCACKPVLKISSQEPIQEPIEEEPAEEDKTVSEKIDGDDEAKEDFSRGEDTQGIKTENEKSDGDNEVKENIPQE
ncbi:hypothetical protein MTBBW1_790053 [Desulfamplus magnetovallimortis]|uniref:Amphi-Trp domain-containing protein n=1 Tax=Desulfamplus magnetovallimortis TaxID=1246637 RepID=A0A1W1HJS3_9BACT|nr:amphi-Trp domain-containing protein [Desulfamplus magnetovallimortis]SLM32655.1 hypothetical protein MTBBW1_790053 [Desulfamplus magnetovallimortis]